MRAPASGALAVEPCPQDNRSPFQVHVDRVLASPEEAEAVLDYFNGFHDGFIKRLTLISHDYFEARGVQVCSGLLDLELEIAHYNYRDGEPPADQLVQASFTHVRHLHTDMPGNP